MYGAAFQLYAVPCRKMYRLPFIMNNLSRFFRRFLSVVCFREATEVGRGLPPSICSDL